MENDKRRLVNSDVFITCAVTGAGATVDKSEHVPASPVQIADAAVEAAKAGAAIAHIHVRVPETGAPARDPRLYRQVVERIRSSGVDVVINLTAGMGGDLVLGGVEKPLPLNMRLTTWQAPRSASSMSRSYARKYARLIAAR